jgi:predicted SAM-dependent methyltransferase
MATESSGGRAFFEANYWTVLKARDVYAARPQPVLRWWDDPRELNDVDRIILEALRSSSKALDIGAGDLRVKRKLQSAGLSAEYLTLDPTREFPHEYSSLDEVPSRSHDAVLLLEVIEHITLSDFFGFMDRVFDVLTPEGVLIISTPNAEFISSIWAADMTHVHAYRAADLAAFLHCHGFRSNIYRVAWKARKASFVERARFQAARLITRGILQVDYARGVLVIARRRLVPGSIQGIEGAG